jgi:hypothetical protein
MQGVRLRRMVPPRRMRSNAADAVESPRPSTGLRINPKGEEWRWITEDGLPHTAAGNALGNAL